MKAEKVPAQDPLTGPLKPAAVLQLLATTKRDWFFGVAYDYAKTRGGIGQDLAEQSFDKAIAALVRRVTPIKEPKQWLTNVIRNAWRDEKKSQAREQRRADLHDVSSGLTLAELRALSFDKYDAIDHKEHIRKRKRERERQVAEWNTRELRPRGS